MAVAYQQEFLEATLLFIVGFDKAEQIFDPKYYKDRDESLRVLFSRSRLAVASRGDNGKDDLESLLAKPQNQPFAQFVDHLPLDSSLADISSTNIRQDAQEGRYDPKEIPPEVEELMRATKVYQRPKGTPEDPIDEYAIRVSLLSLAARTPTAGGDLRPLLQTLLEDSVAGKEKRLQLANNAPWESLC
jgi:hypothetical protein